jgi:hypothetical protein
MAEPLIYFILGAEGSGRREVIADLAVFGLERTDRPCLLAPEPQVAASREILAGLKAGLPVSGWSLEGTRMTAAVPGDVSHIFLLADGTADPIDQIEAFSLWLPTTPYELGRILTVVHCALVDRQPPLLRWYDGCVHFSDVVLLNRREGLPSKWVSEYQARLNKDSLPCHLELVRKGRVRNPALVLYPEPRRISHVFDEEEHLYRDDDDATDEEAVTPLVDPYFERLVSGRRVRELPDIRNYHNGEGGWPDLCRGNPARPA